MKSIVTWILIADGAQARLAYNDGPGHGIKPVSDEVLEGRNLMGREIMADRPGRAFDSFGQGRHAMEPTTDPRQVEKRRFARELAAMLEEEERRGRFDRLVIAAPPKALGNLRAELSAAVRGKVTAELAKDLTQIPINKLERHLAAVMAV